MLSFQKHKWGKGSVVTYRYPTLWQRRRREGKDGWMSSRKVVSDGETSTKFLMVGVYGRIGYHPAHLALASFHSHPSSTSPSLTLSHCIFYTTWWQQWDVVVVTTSSCSAHQKRKPGARRDGLRDPRTSTNKERLRKEGVERERS